MMYACMYMCFNILDVQLRKSCRLWSNTPSWYCTTASQNLIFAGQPSTENRRRSSSCSCKHILRQCTKRVTEGMMQNPEQLAACIVLLQLSTVGHLAQCLFIGYQREGRATGVVVHFLFTFIAQVCWAGVWEDVVHGCFFTVEAEFIVHARCTGVKSDVYT